MSVRQLWLSVFEDSADVRDWPLSLNERNWRVSLVPGATFQDCDHDAPSRTSPVFPLVGEFQSPDLANREVWFSFFCFDPAYPVLGRLLESASDRLKQRVLFTCGLASIVLVSEDASLIDELQSVANDTPFAREIWRVVDARIVNVSCITPPAAALGAADCRVGPYDGLPLASRAAVDEFVSSLGLLVPKIMAHLPSEAETFRSLHELVVDLVREMAYVSSPSGDPPHTLAAYRESDFSGDRSIASTVMHQATDRIVQINGALSYVSTQALSGAVPILERRSIIRRHSLLGVGTGILALTRIARSIERAFALAGVEEQLRDAGATSRPLPGMHNLPEYDPTEWKDYSITHWPRRAGVRRQYPKLPYFSGRLGFRETEYTISAAVQSLVAGASAEWSLMTVTHEMLHGHVRNIISFVLRGDPTTSPDAKWTAFLSRYRNRLLRRSLTNETFLDSFRAAIFSACCMATTHGSLTREADQAHRSSAQFDIVAPKDGAALKRRLELELRNVSEVLVHVLDLHYFYLSNLSNYVPLIWRSWSPLPQVSGDIRQYVLRTLLVAATETAGSPYERFQRSRGRTLELLTPLAADGFPAAATVKHAVGYLSDDTRFDRLFFPFMAALILVDLADRVLTVGILRGVLNGGDPRVEVRPNDLGIDWLEYNMPLDFVDDIVRAPAAYLADRLSRKLRGPYSESPEEETVRLFLACCSFPQREA